MKTKNVVQGIGISMALSSLGIVAGCLALSTTDEGNGNTGSPGMDRCTSVQDCPNVTTCTTMKCIDGSCIPGFVPVGIQCNDNGVCDGAGTCVGCVTDSDCKGASPTCENSECISCNDGIKNGSESSVDCGGSRCGECGLGGSCSSNNDCSEDDDCVDGLCCDASCTGVCKSCNQPGKEGTCSSLPKGTEDPGICDNKKACGANGNCLLKDGQPCSTAGQCLNASCFMGFCF
jgi:hypothetical protein